MEHLDPLDDLEELLFERLHEGAKGLGVLTRSPYYKRPLTRLTAWLFRLKRNVLSFVS